MATPRKRIVPTTEAIDSFCAQFDDLLNRRAARQAFRHYLIGLLLPREHNKTMTVLSSLVPGSDRQRLHHFLHDAPWDPAALNDRRLQLLQEHSTLRPHGRGVLIVDETGDRKRGHGIPFAAQQCIGRVGFTANGVVSATSHWTDGTRHPQRVRGAPLPPAEAAGRETLQAGISPSRGQAGSDVPHQASSRLGARRGGV